MAEHSGATATQEDRDQAAAYVAELTCELALIARRHGLGSLGYLLEMAQMEAENIVRRPRSGNGKPRAGQGIKGA